MKEKKSPSSLFQFYSSSNTPVVWNRSSGLATSKAVVYRNMRAQDLAKEEPEEITKAHVFLSSEEMETLVSKTEKEVLNESFEGIGLELGAGVGLLASIVSRRQAVKGVLAVEVCDDMAKLIIPKISSHVLGLDFYKVVPVIGSFDELDLPDSSVDFAVEIDSFHHSDNLSLTLSECYRVLKPGGFLLCYDRCHPNTLSDEEVDRMLSITYTKDFLVSNGYPLDYTLTRRQNGEHEYRLFEWEEGFRKAGLRLTKVYKTEHPISLKTALKGFLKTLLQPTPEKWRRKIFRSDKPDFSTTYRWLLQFLNRMFLGKNKALIVPRTTTIFLLHKPSDLN